MKLFGITGWSGSGKTTLITKLIPALKKHKLTVATIKHAHHNFEMDREGKDSFRFRQAGATEVMLASSRRWVLLHENSEEADPDPEELLQRMNLDHLDLVLVEGFKHHMLPKIEIHRPSLGRDMMHPDLPGIIALASDETPSDNLDIPWLDLNHPEKIAEFIIEWMKT